MRKVVRDLWKQELAASMSVRLPMFKQLQKKSPGDWPHTMKFIHERSPGFLWAIAFRPLDEQFDAYVGWGKNGKPPFDGLVQIATEDQLSKFDCDALMLPSALVARRSGATYWSLWNPSDDLVDDPVRFAAEFAQYYNKPLTPEEAAELVRLPIAEAISEIETYGLPYLDQAAAHHGIQGGNRGTAG